MKLAICGPGRAGKDTASKWLACHTTLRYTESTSEAAAQLCYSKLADRYGYTSVSEAFEDRHNHRVEWADIIWSYNKPDGITLYCEMLQDGDILNGIRRAAELQALVDRHLIDLVMWIDRDVPTDPSLETTSSVADIIIPNNDSIADLYRRLTHFARFSRIIKGI